MVGEKGARREMSALQELRDSRFKERPLQPTLALSKVQRLSKHGDRMVADGGYHPSE